MLKCMGVFKDIEKEEIYKLDIEKLMICEVIKELDGWDVEWCVSLCKVMKFKEWMVIFCVKMNELDVEYCLYSCKEEVNLGLNEE